MRRNAARPADRAECSGIPAASRVRRAGWRPQRRSSGTAPWSAVDRVVATPIPTKSAGANPLPSPIQGGGVAAVAARLMGGLPDAEAASPARGMLAGSSERREHGKRRQHGQRLDRSVDHRSMASSPTPTTAPSSHFGGRGATLRRAVRRRYPSQCNPMFKLSAVTAVSSTRASPGSAAPSPGAGPTTCRRRGVGARPHARHPAVCRRAAARSRAGRWSNRPDRCCSQNRASPRGATCRRVVVDGEPADLTGLYGWVQHRSNDGAVGYRSAAMAAWSRSRNGTCAAFSLRRALLSLNHSTRSISGKVSKRPDPGGHSSW